VGLSHRGIIRRGSQNPIYVRGADSSIEGKRDVIVASGILPPVKEAERVLYWGLAATRGNIGPPKKRGHVIRSLGGKETVTLCKSSASFEKRASAGKCKRGR